MPHRICPKCQRKGDLLEGASKDAHVDYYRCPICGHVWAHQKGNADAPPKDVTERSHKATSRSLAAASSRQ
jgi:ssDNA-binding Zn-finger/Zn-ribbon topoisomerase 1